MVEFIKNPSCFLQVQIWGFPPDFIIACVLKRLESAFLVSTVGVSFGCTHLRIISLGDYILFNIVKFNCHHWALNTYIVLGTDCHVCWYPYYPVFLFSLFSCFFNISFSPDDFRQGSQVPLGQLSLISEQHWASHYSFTTCTLDVWKEITAGAGSVEKW